MADELDISRQLEESIRQSRRLQQDSNSELNKSINLLSKINDLRDASISKVKALNKETINTKEIQKELQKAREKDVLTSKKIVDIEKSLNDQEKQNASLYLANITTRKKLEEDIQRAKLQNNQAQITNLGAQLTTLDSQILLQESSLNIDERRYAAAIESNKIAKETVDILKEELDVEKEINSSIGFSGKALGFFADKLGLGQKFFGQMVEKARDLNEEGKKLTFADKLTALGKAGVSGIKEAITDPLTAIPIAGAVIGGLVKGLIDAFNYILSIQDKTTKFARAMNLSVDEARKIKMEFADLNISSGDLFITSQKLVESQMEFVDALGVTNRLTNEQLATNIKLKDITGLDLETRKGIIEASTITGQSSEKLTKSVLAQVVGLKQATGISFSYQKILKEASNLGGYLGLSFAKYPAELTKSLVTVKAMGMELKQLDSIADSFLDFESSISKEFEAQLLTGKDINLTKAREAFLNNDLATAAGEITKQVGSANDFLKLNRIQAESLSSAFGMSRDQMGEMLQKQELLTKLGAKQGDSAKDQLRLGLERYKNQKALTAAIGEEAYQSLINASAQEKIAAFIEKIKQSFADFVEKSGIIGVIERFINFLSKPENIRSVLETLKNFFANAVEAVLAIANGVINAIDFITFGFGIDEDFERKFEKFSEEAPKKIRSLGMGGGASETVNVGENAASSNVNSTNSMVNNTSMARPGGSPKVYVMVMVDPVTGKSVEKVVSQEYYETHFGQMGKK